MSDKYNQNKAQFDAKHTTQIKLKLNTKTDSDILDRLEAQPKETGGKQGYIKRLIREDIARSAPHHPSVLTDLP